MRCFFATLLLLALPAQAGELSGRVDNWRDAYTFAVKGQWIRLWGIVAPSTDTAAGRAASQFAYDLVWWQVVECEPKGVRLGRVVARCWLRDGRDVAAELVAAGHARDLPIDSGGFYAQ